MMTLISYKRIWTHCSNGQKTALFMLFNISKCEHLTISNKHAPLNSTYKIDNCIINKVKSAKYLGITVAHNLSWKEHITKITSKANSTHGFLSPVKPTQHMVFLQHNLRQCSTNIKSLAILQYVRPILEYASVFWSPHIQSQNNSLEVVQQVCKAACFIFSSFTRSTSVTSLLEALDWPTLEVRRINACLSKCFTT